MKVKIYSLISILFAICCMLSFFCTLNISSDAAAQQAITLNESDKHLSKSYWDMYAIPNTFFSATNDRGGENTLKNAFDGDWGTYYEATNDADDGSISISFNSEVKLSAIIFAIAQHKSNEKPDGYPATLTIETNDGSKMSFTSTPSKNKMLFLFDEISCTTLKLTFTMKGTRYNWRQTASEIIFLQPEVEEIESIFADYTQTRLSTQFNNESAINALDDKLRNNINYDRGFKSIIERARKILSEEVVFTPTREFSTEANAVNKIFQNGDIAYYCRNTLKMSNMGTNRQITGIYGNSGEEINVYVEAENPDAQLPKIQFSQFNGYLMDSQFRNAWLSGEKTLNAGKNTFVFPTFEQKAGILLGGSIYISNPYTPEQGKVKLYIEGGHEFPVFRKGGNVDEYLDKLHDFVELGKTQTQIDITEMQGENVIITVEASHAQRDYAENSTVNPQQNLEKWDEYIKKLLAFDGIEFEQNKQYYDQKNQFINVNIRLMQPEEGAAAYAAYEHIGVFPVDGDTSWIDNAIQLTQYGWGFAHELGHMLDLPERIVAECSNNMFSMYTTTYITHTIRTPSFYETTLNEILNPTKPSLFDYGERSNYLLWWYIENYFPGYWGKLDNLYRFGENVTGMTPTEKQVYLSSLATGIDLSYYFDKWGYKMALEKDEVFKIGQTSEAFNEKMAEKIASGDIDNTIQPKIWYAHEGNNPDENKKIYDSTQKVKVVSVEEISDGYRLTLPEQTNSAHLGYEIYVKTQEGYNFVAFTYQNVYEDKNSYTSQPEYEIVAVDTSFNCTAMPGVIPEEDVGGTTPGEQLPDSSEDNDEDKQQSSGSSTGLIIGIIASVVGVTAILAAVLVVMKLKRNKNGNR